MFVSAGFLTPRPGGPFYITPDFGASSDVAAFCAALAA
jgi:hypothetical protein